MINNKFQNGSSTKVTVGSSTTAIAAANNDRKYICITNVSSEKVSLAFGEAAVADQGVVLGPAPATGVYDKFIMSGEGLYIGAINGITASGSMDVAVFEA